jgi:hypothetical protein
MSEQAAPDDRPERPWAGDWRLPDEHAERLAEQDKRNTISRPFGSGEQEDEYKSLA